MLAINSPYIIRNHSLQIEGFPSIKILFLSDFHFKKKSEVQSILELIEECPHDLCLLGGDYVDSRKGLMHLSLILSKITVPKIGIWGNHDWIFKKSIRTVFEEHGVTILENQTATISFQNTAIHIFNGTSSNANKNRIALNHHPKIFGQMKDNYEIGFAGHLHGGQIILWENENGIYPAKWIYSWNQSKIKNGSSTLFISKGLGDTLPLRLNCSREIIYINVN